MGGWPFWLSGFMIGLFVVLFAWIAGKAFGVSSSYGSVCGIVSKSSFFKNKPFGERWRLWFLLGFPLGGLLSAALAGRLQPTSRIGGFEALFGESLLVKGAVLVAGGFLIGYGARWAGGCTSGHSVTGLAQGSRSSLVATLGFFAGGVVVTQLLFLVLGGAA
jgi:uncharacterized membrane protein YedE/YeeE